MQRSHTEAHSNTHTNTLKHTHTHTHTHINTYTLKHTHTDTHKHTHLHSNTHAHTHTLYRNRYQHYCMRLILCKIVLVQVMLSRDVTWWHIDSTKLVILHPATTGQSEVILISRLFFRGQWQRDLICLSQKMFRLFISVSIGLQAFTLWSGVLPL